MKKETVEEAIIEVLKKNTHGLTPKEITEKIISQELYHFTAAHPDSVVDHTIRKSCVGVDIQVSKNEEDKAFELAGEGKYKLRKK